MVTRLKMASSWSWSSQRGIPQLLSKPCQSRSYARTAASMSVRADGPYRLLDPGSALGCLTRQGIGRRAGAGVSQELPVVAASYRIPKAGYPDARPSAIRQ